MRSLLLALALLLSPPAYAETVDHLIDRGVSLREQGKDQEALALFEQAYRDSKSPKALAQIALAEQALGRWIEAEAHLSEALALKDKWIAERKKPLAGALEAIRDRLANLEVLGSPEGAQVHVNGKAVGLLPLAVSVRVVAGAVVIDLTKDGFRPLSRTVQVKSRTLARETIELVPELAKGPPPPSPPPPIAPPPPPAVTVETAPMEEAGPELMPYAITAAAGAGVGVILGIVGVVLRAGFINQYNDDALCLVGGLSRDQNCGDKLDSANRFGAMAIGGFVAGGVLAATSVLLFIFDG